MLRRGQFSGYSRFPTNNVAAASPDETWASPGSPGSCCDIQLSVGICSFCPRKLPAFKMKGLFLGKADRQSQLVVPPGVTAEGHLGDCEGGLKAEVGEPRGWGSRKNTVLGAQPRTRHVLQPSGLSRPLFWPTKGPENLQLWHVRVLGSHIIWGLQVREGGWLQRRLRQCSGQGLSLGSGCCGIHPDTGWKSWVRLWLGGVHRGTQGCSGGEPGP